VLTAPGALGGSTESPGGSPSAHDPGQLQKCCGQGGALPGPGGSKGKQGPGFPLGCVCRGWGAVALRTVFLF
jgi:hypothetical protein